MPRLSKIGAAALAAFGWTSGSTVTASYLQVAGGGGGGSGDLGSVGGAGGGAGGYLTGTTTLNPTLSYTVTVGAGGAGGVYSGTGQNGVQGSNSQFDVLTASVGGGYGAYSTSGAVGGNGGSGGGGAYGSAGGTATSGQGSAGGTGSSSLDCRGSGGGGGASAVGSNGSSAGGGNGGNGTASSITGTSVTYAGGGGGGALYRGGGFTVPTVATGGTGGGGNSGTGTGGNGNPGTANLGGGGGGPVSIGAGTFDRGGNGGSGVVIISYVGAQQFGGGVVTSSGGSTIHTFTTSGTLSPLSSLTASYLIVAGGGGGGGIAFNGGGGAGGMLTGSGLTIDTNSTYLVTVGAGGTASGSAKGTNGANSAFSMVTTTAVGGGAGGAGANDAGNSGGSGGGAAAAGSGSSPAAAAGTSGQGFAGGTSFIGASTWGAGGGGGAGAVGSNGASTVGGTGGVGVSSSISGTATFYAGGGGGAAASGTAGSGGNGGGGAGSVSSTGTAGTANLGGGGGAGFGTNSGGAGGSGVVIISYPGSTQQMAGGTVTVAGGNVIHTFTSSGYLAPIFTANNSLRFRSSASAYLNRTPATASNRKTWTWSAWVKRGAIGSGVSGNLFQGGTTSSDTGSTSLSFAVDKLYVQGYSTNWIITNAVYRDPSAWYHVVLAMDTTQATATNRLKLYVNGSEVSYGTYNNLTQNTDYGINQAASHVIGQSIASFGGGYFDGYMTEINFIDGQALTPNSFGTTSDLGVWQPIRYGGSYGTNGFYLKFQQPSTSTYYASFNGSSQSLNAPSSANLALNADLTIEAWVYPTTTSGTRSLVVCRGSFANSTGYAFGINGTNNLFIYTASGFAGTSSTALASNAWSHVAWVRSGSTNTFYINGIASGTFTNSNNYSDPSTNSTFIGTNDLSAEYFTGNISNVRIVKGTAVYTSGFIPQTTPLTAITNTQLLTLQNATIIDNSTNAFTITNTGSVVTTANTGVFLNTTVLASDQSSSGNNWTPNNISLTAGATYDSMNDVPTLTSATTANYATLNPLASRSVGTMQNGNLTWKKSDAAGDNYCCASSISIPSSGKWYWEVTVTDGASGANSIGIIPNTSTLQQTSNVIPGDFGITANAFGYYSDGTKLTAASPAAYGNSFTTGDVIGVAVDITSGKIWWSKNGTFQASGDPAAGTNAAFTTLSGSYYAASSVRFNGNQHDYNFGQRPFAYTPPTGFVALNTFNLPTPTIGATASTTANDYFDVNLYTGNGATYPSSQSITGLQFQPDFTWIKSRSNAYPNFVFDAVRGAGKELVTNDTAAETNKNQLSAFNSNGFSVAVATDGSLGTNGNGSTFVGWNWKANGAGSSNTAGSITSTVSASTTAGFSIVTYTGTGANATVGHGLGVAPSMVIIKNRTASGSWLTYHASIGNTGAVFLNLTNATITSSTYFNNTSPTSTVFSVGDATAGNGSGNSIVAYCFAPVAGYSAFGSYTGNGSTDGPFIYLGFRPRFVLFKNTTTASQWILLDTARNTYNVSNAYLEPNTADTENTASTVFDMLSNGFKLRNAGGTDFNASGEVYIYAAFAENPFKYANAR